MKVFLHFSVAETVREVENLLDWQQHRQEQKKNKQQEAEVSLLSIVSYSE